MGEFPFGDWQREEDGAAARADLLAWLGGGIVWAGVTALTAGAPQALILGASLALLLRRALRTIVKF